MSVTERYHWAGAAHHLLAAAERLGVTKREVLARAELKEADLPPGPGRIAWGPLQALTRAALELTREPGLGLLAGMESSVHLHGVAGAYYMHTSPARASQRVAYQEVWPHLTNLLRFWHEPGDGLLLSRVELIPPEEPLMRIHLHLFLGLHVAAFRDIFGAETALHHLAIQDTPPGDPEHFSRLAGVRVLTGQTYDGIAVPNELADRPFPLADPWLREQLRPQLEAFLRQLDDGRDATLAVSGALEAALREGRPAALPDIAEALRVRPRTLRSRLEAEGTTFTQVLDTARKDLALELLTFPGVKLAAIAAQTGFSDPAAFTRAFRRWTGITPLQWRIDHTFPLPESAMGGTPQQRGSDD